MTHCVVVLALLVSFALINTAAKKCSADFKAYKVLEDNQTGEEIKDMCLEEFDGKDADFDCQRFENSSFDREFLPPVLQNGDSVSQPSELILSPFQYEKEKNGIIYLVSGLNISWESPYSDLAKRYVKGFIFYYHAFDNKPNTNGCRLLRLDSSKAQYLKVRYSYKLEYVAYNSTIRTRIYTVPTPTAQEMEELVKERNVKTAQLIDLSLTTSGPGNWIPSVGLTPGSNGTLTLRLSLSPKRFNLTVFTLFLIKKSYSEFDSYRTKVLYTQVADEEKVTDEYVFKGLDADEYSIVVRPWDPFNRQVGKCLCWEPEGSNRHCKLNCADIRTPWVNLKQGYEGSSLPSTVSVKPYTDRSSNGISENSSDIVRKEEGRTVSQTKEDLNLITGALVGTLVVGLIVMGGVAFRLYRHKPSVKDKINYLVTKKPVDWSSFGSQNTNKGSGGPLDALRPVSLTHKTVYMLYSEDNEAHSQFTDALATFLNVHCRCRVIYRPWCKLAPGQDGMSWVVSNIKSADLVLFVASQGAQLLLESDMSKQVYRDRRISPEGDLFTFGVQSLRLMSSEGGALPQGRVVAVHTGGKRWCQQLLLFPVMYQLPSHLPDMLEKIHQLSPVQAKAHSMHLPMSLKTLPELLEGKQLLSAIAATQKYEKDHPTWFKDKFGPAIPTLTPLQSQVSHPDSDYGSLSPGQSVSSQDISSSDDVGSPGSIFGSPDFKDYLIRTGSTRSTPNTRQRSTPLRNDVGVPSVFMISSELEIQHQSKETDGTSKFGGRSVVTIPSTVDQMSCVKSPEAISEVRTEILSQFLKNVNSSSEWASPPTVTCNPATHRSNFPLPLVPNNRPVNLSNIQPPMHYSDVTSDCLSLALQQINDQDSWGSKVRSHDLSEVMEDRHSIEFDAISV